MKNILNFLLKIILFSFLFLFIDNVIIFRSLAPMIDRYRPATSDITEGGVIPSRQLLHVQVLSQNTASDKRLVFVGSSSVVNGIDTHIIGNQFKSHGLRLEPLNYGMASLLAYELLFIKKELLNKKNKYVIYLYNPSSFSDNFHPSTVEYRWNTNEIIHLAGAGFIFRIPPLLIIRGIASEISFGIRNVELIQYFVDLWLKGKLKLAVNDFDYPIDEPIPPIRKRVPVVPDKPTDLLRSHYITSDTKRDTLGYHGLNRFLRLANQKKIKVIVMPVPEPFFADYGKYRQNINVARIDQRVLEICQRNQIDYIPRSELLEIEKNDTLFRDEVHLHTTGRNRYSLWLADQVAKIESR